MGVDGHVKWTSAQGFDQLRRRRDRCHAAGGKIHDVALIGCGVPFQRAARRVKDHSVAMRLESLHDHRRAGEGHMAAQRHFRRGGEPTHAILAVLRHEKRRLGQIVLASDRLQDEVSAKKLSSGMTAAGFPVKTRLAKASAWNIRTRMSTTCNHGTPHSARLPRLPRLPIALATKHLRPTISTRGAQSFTPAALWSIDGRRSEATDRGTARSRCCGSL